MTRESAFDISAETRLRLDILSTLYHQQRTDQDNPRLTSRELELELGANRGSLNFALWYLKGKGYVALQDSGAFGISPAGVDFLEEQVHKGRVAGLVHEPETVSARYCAGDDLATQDATLPN